MRKAMIIALATVFAIVFIFSCLPLTIPADDQMAVESVGEINAKDNSTGTVIAGTTADLILTMIADMSQAEPGEEIHSIRITMPTGFSANDNAVTALTVGGEKIKDFESVVDENRIIVVMPRLITLTTTVSIEFRVNTPATPGNQWSFIVALLNVLQNPILFAIKSGNSDGRVNNDKLVLKVIVPTKPDPPTGLKVQPDSGGENDLILSWDVSTDEAVSGYLVFRSDKGDEPIADVTRREKASYIDVDLPPGNYSYTVRSYKTQILRSDPSNEASGTALPDTKAPESPVITPEVVVIEKGIEILWAASPSRDVIKYIIYRGPSLNSLEEIGNVNPTASSYIDENPPTAGSYIYVVAAIDEVGNESKSASTQPRHALSGAKPQPNPFTPLSADSRYNNVTFPSSILEGGEGIFAVKVFDLEGDLVFEKEAEEGLKEIKWDGKDPEGVVVNSGIYVYQATMGDKYKIGTIIVAR